MDDCGIWSTIFRISRTSFDGSPASPLVLISKPMWRTGGSMCVSLNVLSSHTMTRVLTLRDEPYDDPHL